jgi:hypothetical protein
MCAHKFSTPSAEQDEREREEERSLKKPTELNNDDNAKY